MTSVYLAGPSSEELGRARAVHVWTASLAVSNAALSALRCVLSADERARAGRFVFDRDRRSYVATHGLLRFLLSDYTGALPEALQFRTGTRGKPALAYPADEGLEFNMSHSAGFACFAITRGAPVGVDVERIRPVDDLDTLARQHFAPAEIVELQALDGECRTTAFFDAWTRKEAYIKAIGDGLSCPLESFEVTLAPGAPARIRRIDRSEIAAAHWSMHAFRPAPGVVAAAAVRERNVKFQLGWIYTDRSRIAR